METIEILENEQQIAENQIAFDFDNLPSEEIEEESSVIPEEALNQVSFDWVKDEVLFVVVKKQSENNFDGFDSLICGRPMIDWVLMAGGGCETKVVNDNENIISVLKNIQTEKQYMIVLYSDTPLVSKGLVCKIVDYFARNRLNAMTLLRGYVFRTSYLKEIDNFILGCLDKFDEKAFMQVKDGQSLKIAYRVLQDKILDYHEKNGVVIFDRNSVVIDADVEIDVDVVIKQNNCLKGSSVIEKGAMLCENNVIVNSIIGEGTSVTACRIVDSNISAKKSLVGVDILEAKY